MNFCCSPCSTCQPHKSEKVSCVASRALNTPLCEYRMCALSPFSSDILPHLFRQLLCTMQRVSHCHVRIFGKSCCHWLHSPPLDTGVAAPHALYATEWPCEDARSSLRRPSVTVKKQNPTRLPVGSSLRVVVTVCTKRWSASTQGLACPGKLRQRARDAFRSGRQLGLSLIHI